ncbi:hypothetical protein [Alistipes sp. ZOR0009]|jgi:hypothetical protein|uniref:hypothetical protein n=1 Tax=Alistipes sp. ZOR0009 TaxID=1339253 RepID=UPI0012DFF43D|nr:hypothetical protein [Alistipes sp. ZOR0009]
MKKARLYLAIFAYVIFVRRMVNQTLRRAFYLYRRGDRLIQRFKSIIAKAKKAPAKVKTTPIFHIFTCPLAFGQTQGYQIQILRI